MKILSFITLITVSVVFVHCGGGGGDPEPKPTQEEIVSEKLIAGGNTNWGTGAGSNVKVGGVDVTTDLFSGFTMKFAASTFTTTGTTPVFSRNDTWSFKPNSNATIIVRGDGREITIVNLTDAELVLQMEWDQTTTSGRMKSIPGTHVFTLKK